VILLCARVFSRAAAILKSEKTLGMRLVYHKLFSICSVFSFQIFLQLLCISLVPLNFRYSSQIMLENALLCRQNARLKNRLLCSKLCWHNLSKPIRNSCHMPFSKLMPPFTLTGLKFRFADHKVSKVNKTCSPARKT